VPLADRPERWDIYGRMADELGRMGPVFIEGRQIGPPAGLDPALSAAAFKKGGRQYLVLLNPALVSIALNTAVMKGWRPLFEERRGLPADMPPLSVIILEK